MRVVERGNTPLFEDWPEEMGDGSSEGAAPENRKNRHKGRSRQYVGGPDRPSATRAIRMKCHVCMGECNDGRMDCEIQSCPLYWWHPYRKLEPDLSWVEKKFRISKSKPNAK